MNPFRYGQVVEGDDYCPRINLEKQIKEFVRSSQNISLQGERRVGKTSLVTKTVNSIRGKRLLYIDLLEVKSIDSVCKRIIKSIISLEQKRGFLEKFLKSISYLRPVISIDPITGQPAISLSQEVKLEPNSLEEIFELIKKIDKESNLVVVIDEFQDILNIKECRELLAIFRGKIQFHTKIPYIFTGSIRNKMYEIFNDPDSPFYKAAIAIEVGLINEIKFKNYLIDKFQLGKRDISKDLLDDIFATTGNISGDVQQFCSALWEVTSYRERIKTSHLPKALELIYTREIKGYELVLTNLTEMQLRCLVGLAKVENPKTMSAVFLKSIGGILPASAKKSFVRMENLKIIYKYEKRYKFINPFFKSWLKTIEV